MQAEVQVIINQDGRKRSVTFNEIFNVFRHIKHHRNNAEGTNHEEEGP